MKKISMAVCLILAACNAVDSGQELNQNDDTLDLGVVDSEVLQCGIGCGGGYHPASYLCNFSCGSCSFGNNQTDCQPNNDSFFTCGIGCPSGWHVTGYYNSLSCNISGGSITNNQSYCQPNSGSSFFKCGIGCPAPYRAVSYNNVPSCNIAGGSINNNQTYCQL